MKKTSVILFTSIIALFAIGLFLVINAQTIVAENAIPTSYEQVQNIAEKVPDNPQQTADIGKAYLKQEWTKILEKSQFGKILLAISGVLTFFDFYWTPVLGMQYALSWEFIFGVAILILLTKIFYEIGYVFFDKKGMSVLAGFILASLVGTSGVINKALTLLTFAKSNVWIATLSLFIAIVLIFLVGQGGKMLKEELAKQKEKAEKEEEKRSRTKLKHAAKIAEKEYLDAGAGI